MQQEQSAEEEAAAAAQLAEEAAFAVAAMQAKQALRIDTVRIGPAQRSAVINGRDVAEGQMLGDWRVAAIDEGAVTLSWKGREFRLTQDEGRFAAMKQGRILRPAGGPP
ncbi:hypothetical protein MAIT1_01733 [Magnetofaba australis IT-1]|uniref:Type II secretion system protein GspB C-terminal domain-containing protein n=2 Tax=Magnetofaba TaxID=1472292 RepID=A0A1Y2K103_9PROT|nr:hypothetical protein MAIT1_01733 [Magnetofaba australis IT-1]